MGEPGSKGTWSDTKKTWFIVEAYPLFAAIGMGLGVCTLHCARHMFFSPDVFISKSNRSNAMIENYKEGEKWKGSLPLDFQRHTANLTKELSHLQCFRFAVFPNFAAFQICCLNCFNFHASFLCMVYGSERAVLGA